MSSESYLDNLRMENDRFREDRDYDRKELARLRLIVTNLVNESKATKAEMEQLKGKTLLVPEVLYVTKVPGKGRVPCCVLRDVKTDSEMSNSKMKGSYFIQLDWLDNIIHGRYTGSSYFNFSPFDMSKMNRFR